MVEYAAAKVVSTSEVEFVFFGDRYMSVAEFVEEEWDTEDLPEYVFVANRYPLRIYAKARVEDFTAPWDENFTEWPYPPEWTGSDEFQEAIDVFIKAAKKFEAANREWYGMVFAAIIRKKSRFQIC